MDEGIEKEGKKERESEKQGEIEKERQRKNTKMGGGRKRQIK